MKPELNVDIRQALRDIEKNYRLTKQDVEKARKRALIKLTRWLAAEVRRAIAKKNFIKQAAIKRRFYRSVKAKGGDAKVWVGLNAIAASMAGKVVQNSKGVRVGKHEFPNAFAASVYGGKVGVHMRKHTGKGSYRRSAFSLGSEKKEMWGRFPLYTLTIAIDEEAEQIAKNMMPLIEAKASLLLARELEYLSVVK